MKNLNKNYLRKAAGLNNLKEETISAKNLNSKSEVYRIFANFIADLESIKEVIIEDKPKDHPGSMYMNRFKGQVDKESLKKLVFKNLEDVKEKIEELFNNESDETEEE